MIMDAGVSESLVTGTRGVNESFVRSRLYVTSFPILHSMKMDLSDNQQMPKKDSSDIQPADLLRSWHIPRPTLARSSGSSERSTTSSNSSTQSTKSGALLLTAANLARVHLNDASSAATTTSTTTNSNNHHGRGHHASNLQYYIENTFNQETSTKEKDPDAVSLASSMNFTIVHMGNNQGNSKRQNCCKKHQLTILIMTMCSLFSVALIAAVLLMEYNRS